LLFCTRKRPFSSDSILISVPRITEMSAKAAFFSSMKVFSAWLFGTMVRIVASELN